MKKTFAILLVSLFCFTGCSWFTKTTDQVKNTDWDSVCTWYGYAVTGLDSALTFAEMVDSKDAPLMETVVRPCIAAAKKAGDALCASAKSYKAGTLSATELVKSAKEVEGAYKAAAAAVGGVTGAKETTAVPTQ